MCKERDYPKREVAPFGGRYERIPIYDHNATTMGICSCYDDHGIDNIITFVNSANNWLVSDPSNIIVVHCKVIRSLSLYIYVSRVERDVQEC